MSPIKRLALTDEVLKQLEGLIGGGLFHRGDRLPPETELARQLGVGRSTVREALVVLAARGTISRSRRGTFVADGLVTGGNLSISTRNVLAFTQMEHLVEARQMLESELASLCASRCTDEDLRDLEDSLQRMTAAEEVADVNAFAAADAEFHLLLARGAQNTVLANMLEVTRSLLIDVIQELLTTYPELRKRALAYHRAVLDAVRTEKPDLARQITAEHMADIGQAMSRMRSEKR